MNDEKKKNGKLTVGTFWKKETENGGHYYIGNIGTKTAFLKEVFSENPKAPAFEVTLSVDVDAVLGGV